MMAYTFPSTRGHFGLRMLFTAQVPVRVLRRLFPPHLDDELPPNLRAQRTRDDGRIDGIVRYLIDNPATRFLPSFTAVIDGEHSFEPVGHEKTNPALLNVGTLSISMEATLAVLDGQHRLAALLEACKLGSEASGDLGEEMVTITFMPDPGLASAQQVFADLNFNARKPPSSLGVLYDHRDALAAVARDVAMSDWLLKGRVELERPTPRRRSLKLFSLAHLAKACAALLGKRKGDPVTQEERDFAAAYFTTLSGLVPWWTCEEVTIRKDWVMEDTIALAAVTLHALGYLGAAIMADVEGDTSGLRQRLKPLEGVDWKRTAEHWQGRCIADGKLMATATAAQHIAAYLKAQLELPLSPKEVQLEAQRARALAEEAG